MGVSKDKIVLFNSATYGYKSLDRDKFLLEQCGKNYDELCKCSTDSLTKIVTGMPFPLSNKEDLVAGILEGLECQYLLNMETSVFMTVATVDMTVDVVRRIDNNKKTLNAESYWMTWPESANYHYGTLIECNAFEYVVQIGKSYKEAKEELFDFANSGLSDILDRRMMLGIQDSVAESSKLKGLCTYKYQGEEQEIDVLEVDEGVNLLEKGAFPPKLKIGRLVLPSTLLFIQEGAIASNVKTVDMSKTQVTKIKNIFEMEDMGIQRVILPNTLVEFICKFDSYMNYSTYTRFTIPKSVRAMREVIHAVYDFEPGSELEYYGHDSYNANNNGSNNRSKNVNNTTFFKEVKINGWAIRGYCFHAPKLRFIDSDAVIDINAYRQYSAVNYIFYDAKLNSLSKGLISRHKKNNSRFYVCKNSEAYAYLQDKMDINAFDSDDLQV